MTAASEPMTTYSNKQGDDLSRGYRWLDHKAYTELIAIDVVSKRSSAIAYVRAGDLRSIDRFVRRHKNDRLVCWGINERPRLLLNEQGYARAARNSDIEIVSNLALDIDIRAKKFSKAHYDGLISWVRHEANDYYCDLGGLPPVIVYTGRGVHLLTALPRTKVTEYPNIAENLARYNQSFSEDTRDQLDRLEARVDAIQDLRRVLRVPSTAKPGIGHIARLHGTERQEDQGLLEHILSLKVSANENNNGYAPYFGPTLVPVGEQPPPIFTTLLKRDKKLRDLWEGRGKSESSDTSGSGYDISLVRRCLILGIYDVSQLASILAYRPNGSVQNSGKGEDYIRRTIAKALVGR